MTKPQEARRRTTLAQSAHIDGYKAACYTGLAIAAGITLGAMYAKVINPWYIGVSAIAVAIYVQIIVWAARQAYNVHYIMFIAVLGFVLTPVILAGVPTLLQAGLPVELPVLPAGEGMTRPRYPGSIHLWSSDNPGIIAISFGLCVAVIAGIGRFLLGLLDNTRQMTKFKSWLRTQQLDEKIDVSLEAIGFQIYADSRVWWLVPVAALAVIAMIVIAPVFWL